MKKFTRRDFLKATGTTVLVSALATTSFEPSAFAEESKLSFVIISGVISFDEEPQECDNTSAASNKSLRIGYRFNIDDGTQTRYASINKPYYSYFKDAFNGCSLTLNCIQTDKRGNRLEVPETAYLVEGENQTKISNYLFDRYKGTEEHPNFFAYKDILLDDSVYTTFVPSDGSYMEIKSQWAGAGSVTLFDVYDVNSNLGLPNWLNTEIRNTTTADGRRKEVFDHITVSWSYNSDHPLSESEVDIVYRTN